jgi:hypothetical protein
MRANAESNQKKSVSFLCISIRHGHTSKSSIHIVGLEHCSFEYFDFL